MSIRKEDMDRVNDFMRDPENLKKLTPTEAAYVNLCFMQYQEKIAPVVMKVIARDKGKGTFLFRL